MAGHKYSSAWEGRGMTCHGSCKANHCCWCGKPYESKNLSVAIVYGDEHMICSHCVDGWVLDTRGIETVRQLLFRSGPKQKADK